MLLMRFIEFVVIPLLVVGVITQVLIPALRGTPSFPMFHREPKLLAELEEVNQLKVELDLENRLKKEIEKLKCNTTKK